ncbi:aromatic amino acid aminotransferase apoenzyme [Gemmobacter megaterium]|uniref:Aminotransferase n=1 Tax=Gemmobacter megaterium TaxID=1086013 RepID=A0A1N7PW65_9RHOB|nr:amino acid aminotransferase [Gemmobacter megaterium]GGE21743.1 aromatic amino acid aminotransferase [Gemmobacter megaterium]SIT14795.1 aromatic amino acid aminotransferase apoenzyme [Gemmobacter megaterium]
MLERLLPQPEDKIIQLMALLRDDPRPAKIDLGVGVYKDASGHTPVMRAVREAGRRLWDSETTKTYVALAGDPGFHAAMGRLVLGDAVPPARLAAAAAPGGTGALRIGFDLIHKTAPGATIWMSDPTWPNHPALASDLGLKTRDYRYFDSATGDVDFDGMLSDIGSIPDGDVLLLHGCCHNPTGANLTPAQWDKLADVLAARKLTVLIDIAYQGFGDGLEEDAYGTRLLAKRLPELLVAASCSKNFGVYRDRVGVLLAVIPEGTEHATVQANLAMLNRLNYSFPPDHGARLVQTVLNDTDLMAGWQAELEDVRLSMLGLRKQLADELRRLTNSDRFDFVARHRGMFSRLGLSPDQVARLRTDHAIYMVGDSRINIAGLNANSVPILARAIAAVI